jgi:hypothetical protein
MKSNSTLFVIVGCAVLLGVLYLLSIKRPIPVAVVEEAAQSYLDLHDLANTTPLDFAQIDAAYSGSLKRLVEWVDKKDRRKIHLNVEDAIQSGAEGTIPEISAEIVDILCLHAIYRLMFLEIDRRIEPGEFTDVALQNMKTCFAAIQKIALEIDARIGPFPDLQKRLDAAYQQVIQAPLQSQALVLAKADLEREFSGLFLLAIMFELNDIEPAMAKDWKTALIEIAQAKLYYEFVFELHSLQERKDATRVMGEFRTIERNFDVPTIRAMLKKAFVGWVAESTPDRFEKPTPEKAEEPTVEKTE